jgi:hypothetical protein
MSRYSVVKRLFDLFRRKPRKPKFDSRHEELLWECERQIDTLDRLVYESALIAEKSSLMEKPEIPEGMLRVYTISARYLTDD